LRLPFWVAGALSLANFAYGLFILPESLPKENRSRFEWKKANPGKTDVVQSLIAQFSTPARFQKAVQHLKEQGLLDGSPKDIGPLLKECGEDIERECRDEITNALFNWAWPQIRRGATAGLPLWYKDELLKSAFEDVA